MRKNFVFLIGILALILVGCGNKVDEEALQRIATGLEKRWAYADQLPKEVTVEELEKAVQLELDELEKYDADDFRDVHLYVLYDNYRSDLKLIKTLMHGKSADSVAFQEQWKEHMEERSKTLYDLNKDYSLDIPDENEEIFEDILAKSGRLVEIEEMKKVISEIKTLNGLKVDIEENSIAVFYNTEGAFSDKSFVATKLGFPSQAIDILKVLSDYDYDDVVIITLNNEVVAASVYFDKNTLIKVDFDRWDKLDSTDAYKFYAMTKAYHIRLGIWENLDAETKKLVGDMNKRDDNIFWNDRGFVYQ